MRFKLELSSDEMAELVRVHIKERMGIDVDKEDIYWNYGSCEIGRYTMIEHPPKPKKAAPPIPTEPAEVLAETMAESLAPADVEAASAKLAEPF